MQIVQSQICRRLQIYFYQTFHSLQQPWPKTPKNNSDTEQNSIFPSVRGKHNKYPINETLKNSFCHLYTVQACFLRFIIIKSVIAAQQASIGLQLMLLCFILFHFVSWECYIEDIYQCQPKICFTFILSPSTSLSISSQQYFDY